MCGRARSIIVVDHFFSFFQDLTIKVPFLINCYCFFLSNAGLFN